MVRQSNVASEAYVEITEQPAAKSIRFRYECEGRFAGSIHGVNSTPENKTYPTIQVVGYRGRAIVVVSCVTKDYPYRPHPNNITGKKGCKKGICTEEINSETMAFTFNNVGIKCIKRKDVTESLRIREELSVDPFGTGFKLHPSLIDLNAVRLCFQVFLEGDKKGSFTVPLKPIVSDPIYDKKAVFDLVIYELSHCSCLVDGGQKIILVCKKVAKDDILVRFYEEQYGQLVWESFADAKTTIVYSQAISFKAPKYQSPEVDKPVKIFIQLKRPSDGATSEPLPFELLPLDSDPTYLKRKRKIADKNNSYIQRVKQLQSQIKEDVCPIGYASTDIPITQISPNEHTVAAESKTNTSSLYNNVFEGNYPTPPQESSSNQPPVIHIAGPNFEYLVANDHQLNQLPEQNIQPNQENTFNNMEIGQENSFQMNNQAAEDASNDQQLKESERLQSEEDNMTDSFTKLFLTDFVNNNDDMKKKETETKEKEFSQPSANKMNIPPTHMQPNFAMAVIEPTPLQYNVCSEYTSLQTPPPIELNYDYSVMFDHQFNELSIPEQNMQTMQENLLNNLDISQNGQSSLQINNLDGQRASNDQFLNKSNLLETEQKDMTDMFTNYFFTDIKNSIEILNNMCKQREGVFRE